MPQIIFLSRKCRGFYGMDDENTVHGKTSGSGVDLKLSNNKWMPEQSQSLGRNSTSEGMLLLLPIPCLQWTEAIFITPVDTKEIERKMAESAFAPALRVIPFLRSSTGQILTGPFLDVCRSALRVLDKLGSSMAVIRSDIGGNIQRLDVAYESDKSVYSILYEIVRREAAEGTAKKPPSCTNALLWLTRSMDFTLVLLRKLVDNPDWTMTQAIEDSYNVALKQWHGWISAAAFKVALKLLPSRKIFMEMITINVDEDHRKLNEEIESFISSMSPILQEIHTFMVTCASSWFFLHLVRKKHF